MKELISENYINEVELDDGEDETHELGNHQCEGALVEPPGVVDDEVAKAGHLLLHWNLGQWILAQLLDQLPNSSTLLALPPGPGQVAEDSLEYEEKTNPLIVVVVDGSSLCSTSSMLDQFKSRLIIRTKVYLLDQ